MQLKCSYLDYENFRSLHEVGFFQLQGVRHHNNKITDVDNAIISWVQFERVRT